MDKTASGWDQWKKEPLLHFLLLGALLFGVGYWRDKTSGDGSGLEHPIVVEAEEITGMIERFENEYRRPPSEAEVQNLVDARIREELFYREALNRNLNEDDPIIRQHMAEEMQYLIEDLEANLNPTEEDLRQYYETQSNKFSVPGRISFQQVFFDPKTRSKDGALSAAGELLERLQKDPDLNPGRGDEISFPGRIRAASQDDLIRFFGSSFVETIFSLEGSVWTGPWESLYGYHLVRVLTVRPPEQIPFDRVEQEVRLSWIETNKAVVRERWTDDLLKQYSVRIEWPELDEADEKDVAKEGSAIPES